MRDSNSPRMSVLSKKNAVLLIRKADREVPAVMDLRTGLTGVLEPQDLPHT